MEVEDVFRLVLVVFVVFVTVAVALEVGTFTAPISDGGERGNRCSSEFEETWSTS